ncbi:unnamed protein product [Fraxinus pennsylvanica]|uniref:RNase H type-1 domain-containing protein n=1 Tax=Fraxinus pennsylvanica TaxID=56036 RepID=A0AAD2E913_9LAMI|nr:unnamed protein product [Fraxinus pennsylvanica]
MSRAADRCHHFFKAIVGSINFEWIKECQESLESLKQSLQQPPVLTRPCSGDVLSLFLAVSKYAVSAVPVKEFPEMHKHIYYFSQVMTDQPVKQILHRLETSGRMLKWTIEQSEFDIVFRPRTAIKAQVLVDFIVELTTPPDYPLQTKEFGKSVDGSSYGEGSRAGIIMIGPEFEELEYSLRFEFSATYNDAEYEAIITGLSLAAILGMTSVEICSDSKLIFG